MANVYPFVAETSLWPDRSIPSNILDQATHIISLQYFDLKFKPHHNGFVLYDDRQRKTYVYRQRICEWLGLNFSTSPPNTIEELDGKIIKQVDYGKDFIAMLTADSDGDDGDGGQVYLAGMDSFWKTGNKLKRLCDKNEQTTKFKQIAAGFGHLLLLTTDNRLLAMGWNESGQITGNHDSYEKMIDTGLRNVTKMSCGFKHSLAMNDNNEIFSWGSNEYGRLGLGDNKNRNKPCSIRFESKIKDIAAGHSHSLFLTEDEKFYFCGLYYNVENSEMLGPAWRPELLMENITSIATGPSYPFSMAFDAKRQCLVLGLLGAKEYLDPTKMDRKVKSFCEASSLFYPDDPLTFGWTRLIKPRTKHSEEVSFSNLELWRKHLKPIPDGFLETITHFISLQCYNSDHENFTNNGYVMTTYNKETFVYGETICGWISLTHQPDKPQLIEMLKNKTVRLVDYGEDYFVILTTDGQVYLGADPNSHWTTDRKLTLISNENEKFKPIQTVSCGANKILLLTEDNELVEFIRFRCVGINNLRGAPRFTELWTVKLNDVIRMDCGRDHCLAIKKDGTIYSWGNNNNGQLGLGNPIAQNEPKLVKFSNLTSKPKDLAAGDSYSLFLMEDGRLYECGRKKSTPFKLDIENVISIVSRWSYRFSMAFTADKSCYVWGVINGMDTPTRTIKQAKSFSEASCLYPVSVSIPLTFGWTSLVKSKPDFMMISHQFIALWKEHLGNIEDDFLVSIKHFLSMQWFDEDYVEHHNGYVITTDQNKTLVYGEKVCRWLDFDHQTDRPQVIEELDDQSIQQVDHGSNYLAVLTENGLVYLGGEDSVWKTGKKLKQLCGDGETTKFKQIACGSKHLLLLTKQNKLMAMGDNSFNQITGSGNSYENLVNIDLDNVMKIFCGDYHCLAITDDFKIYSWGSNQDGQLGLGDKRVDRHQPDFIRQFDSLNVRIKDIAANRSNSYFLTEDNELYGCGTDTYGQLGLEKSSEHPVQMLLGPDGSYAKNVIAIASGWSFRFFMAFTIDNSCHVWGLVGDRVWKKPTKTVCSVSSFTEASSMYFPEPLTFGWTGVVESTDGNVQTHVASELSLWNEWLPEKVNKDFRASITHFISLQWFDGETYKAHHNGFVLSTDEGNHHRLLSSKKTLAYGKVCDWLSLPNEEKCFQQIPELDGKCIKQVDYGQTFVLFLIDDGKLYLAGASWKLQCVPIAGHKLTQIACGREHLLLLTTQNKLLATNTDPFQKRENSDSDKVMLKYIETDLKNVTKISCGWQHSLAIANDHQVYSFGSIYDGRSDSSEAESIDQKLCQPVLIGFFEKTPVKCVDVVAGQSHSLFLMEDGTLYCSGNNDYGQLGVVKRSVKFETPIRTPVVAIRSGWSCRFTIAFTIDHRCWIWGWIGDRFYKKPSETNRLVASFSEASGLYLSQPLTFGWIEDKKQLK